MVSYRTGIAVALSFIQFSRLRLRNHFSDSQICLSQPSVFRRKNEIVLLGAKNSTLSRVAPISEETPELQDAYLRAILATVARQTFSPTKILEIMGPGSGEKQLRAFNLCDGSRSQADIAKELGLDSGNFSKTLTRWIDEGIVIRIGEKREARPLHVYPLPEAFLKKGAKK